MVKLDERLERRFDNYAILYCFHHDQKYVEEMVSGLLKECKYLVKKEKLSL